MKPDTALAHAGGDPQNRFGIVNPPVYRASTVLFRTVEDFERRAERKYTGFWYGTHGTPTTFALTEALAELSGGHKSLVTSSGLSAIAQALTAFLRQGDHVLVADSVYGPTRLFCTSVLARFGVDVTFYDPVLGNRRAHAADHQSGLRGSPRVPDIRHAGYTGNRESGPRARGGADFRQHVGHAP